MAFPAWVHIPELRRFDSYSRFQMYKVVAINREGNEIGMIAEDMTKSDAELAAKQFNEMLKGMPDGSITTIRYANEEPYKLGSVPKDKVVIAGVVKPA